GRVGVLVLGVNHARDGHLRCLLGGCLRRDSGASERGQCDGSERSKGESCVHGDLLKRSERYPSTTRQSFPGVVTGERRPCHGMVTNVPGKTDSGAIPASATWVPGQTAVHPTA